MDLTFLNEVSVRGFAVYLSGTCGVTSYPLRLLVRNKRPPADLIKWIIDVFEIQWHKVLFMRFDE